MKHFFKSSLVIFILCFGLSASFSQVTHTIELRLDPVTHALQDPGTIKVDRGDYVKWTIKEGEDIRGFKIVATRHLFNNLPNFYLILLGKTVPEAANDGEWKYIIFYQKISTTTIFHLDPKIAVKPRKSSINIVILTSLIFTSIATIIFFVMWRIAVFKLKKAGIK